jgi:hypothetical protein
MGKPSDILAERFVSENNRATRRLLNKVPGLARPKCLARRPRAVVSSSRACLALAHRVTGGEQRTKFQMVPKALSPSARALFGRHVELGRTIDLEANRATYEELARAGLGRRQQLCWGPEQHLQRHEGGLHLKELTNLEDLTLENDRITDAGLVQLMGRTKLARLYVNRTNVTDDGLAHLVGLTNLSQLGLERTQISDAGLVHLKGLTGGRGK